MGRILDFFNAYGSQAMLVVVVISVSIIMPLATWESPEEKMWPFIAHAHKADLRDFLSGRFDPYAVVVVRNTTNGRGRGLFATQDLPVFAPLTTYLDSEGLSNIYNDALFDMAPFKAAKTDQEMYNAFVQAHSKYHNVTRADELVNVVMSSYNVYVTRLPVRKGEELLRCYGFTTWVMELGIIDLLTLNTVKGYIDYVSGPNAYKKRHYTPLQTHYFAKVAGSYNSVMQQIEEQGLADDEGFSLTFDCYDGCPIKVEKRFP